MFHNKRKSIIDKAKKLRREQTEAEAVLWEELRKRKLDGYKIRRQHFNRAVYRGFLLRRRETGD